MVLKDWQILVKPFIRFKNIIQMINPINKHLSPANKLLEFYAQMIFTKHSHKALTTWHFH